MKKKVILWAVLFCTLLLIACGSDKSRDTNDTVEVVESEVVEGKDILSGTWYIGAIYYNNNLIDIQDVDALADLYDSVFLTFNDDGTFIYTDRYNYKGEYSKYEQSDYESYLLQTTSLSTYDLENGQIVEKEVEAEPTSLRTFMITVLDEGNTFEFSEYDPASGKAKVDEEPFVFVKDNSSDYIEDNKAEINNETQENEKSKNNTDKNENNQSSYIKPSTPDYSGNVSSGMRNALNRAKEYLDYTAFSYSGLIDQLEFEGFTKEEATYGADNCGADWNEQAVKKAEEYLDYTSFSYSGLIDQLEFEGFTRSQAEYGASIAY